MSLNLAVIPRSFRNEVGACKHVPLVPGLAFVEGHEAALWTARGKTCICLSRTDLEGATLDSAFVPTLILAGHGTAIGLFGLLACLLWRDRHASAVGRLSAILAAGAVAHGITSVPGFQPGMAIWRFPLLALAWGNPAIFWQWSWAAFGDRFRLRWWYTLPWLSLVGGWSFVAYAGWRLPGAVPTLKLLLPLLAAGLAAIAAGHILTTWRGDLVRDRRTLRLLVLLGIVGDIAVGSSADLVPGLRLPGLWSGEIVDTAAQCALAAMASWYLLRVDRNERAVALLPTSTDAIGDDTPALPAVPAPTQAANSALLHRIEQLMVAERIYREEGLTIGALAARLRLPEYRLRQAINEGLGHRNFNVFLNRYRLGDAKAALSTPDQAGVPILTIALDAGFQSIGPFNRAFKADTGMTPTEYRQACLAKQAAKPLTSKADSEISKTV